MSGPKTRSKLSHEKKYYAKKKRVLIKLIG